MGGSFTPVLLLRSVFAVLWGFSAGVYSLFGFPLIVASRGYFGLVAVF